MTVNSYTDVMICGAALVLVGESGINSIENPQSDKEATCATLYGLTLSTLLSKHPWNFANPVRELAADADASDDVKQGYANAYRLPANMISGPSAVFNSRDRRRTFHDYLISGDYLLADSDVIFIRYSAKPDIQIMPEYFIDLFITALAMRFAKPIADNTALAQELRIQAYGPAELDGEGGMYAAAKRSDSTAQPMRSMFENGDPLSATRY